MNIPDALDGRVRDDDTYNALAHLLADAYTTDTITPHSDTAATLAALMEAIADDPDTTAPDTSPHLVAVRDYLAYVQDMEGGDPWGIEQELRDAANILNGVARDYANDNE